MNHWMFRCDDISHLISQSMDDTLPLHVRIGIRLHLIVCRWCTRYKKQLTLIHQSLIIMDNDADILPPKKLPEDVKHRLKRLLG